MKRFEEGEKTLSLHAFNSSLCGFIWGISKNVEVVSLCGYSIK